MNAFPVATDLVPHTSLLRRGGCKSSIARMVQNVTTHAARTHVQINTGIQTHAHTDLHTHLNIQTHREFCMLYSIASYLMDWTIL